MEKGGTAWRGFFPVGFELTSGKPDQKVSTLQCTRKQKTSILSFFRPKTRCAFSLFLPSVRLSSRSTSPKVSHRQNSPSQHSRTVRRADGSTKNESSAWIWAQREQFIPCAGSPSEDWTAQTHTATPAHWARIHQLPTFLCESQP